MFSFQKIRDGERRKLRDTALVPVRWDSFEDTFCTSKSDELIFDVIKKLLQWPITHVKPMSNVSYFGLTMTPPCSQRSTG